MRAQRTIAWVLAASLSPSLAQEAATVTVDKRYLAYRAAESLSSERREALLEFVARIGMKPLESRALQREGIVVFEAPHDLGIVRRVERLAAGMVPLPVHDYKGSLSVPTGYFYLQFEDKVPVDEMRKRIADAGFKLVTPDPAKSAFVVVAGSRLPADREAELAKLKKMPELLFVAPDDIPLPLKR